MQSWIWNLDTSRLRRLLQECIVCPHINVWAMVGPQCTHLDTNNVMTAAERPKRERDVPTVEMMSRANLTAAGCSSQPHNLVRMSYKLTNQIWLQTWNSNVHVTALFTRARNLLAKCNRIYHTVNELRFNIEIERHNLLPTKMNSMILFINSEGDTYHQVGKVGKVTATTGNNTAINFSKFTSISGPVSTAT